MRGHTHIFKRGQRFHWRRRMRRQSTGFFDLKLSLYTSNPHIAAILGRKLSSESDTVMRNAVHNLISEDDARVWLTEVIRRERVKLDMLEVFRRTDSRDPDEDLRHNASMQAAWAHIAQHGMHANTAPSTDYLVAKDIELLLRDLTSDARRNIILREFADITGEDVESTRETLAVLDLYIQAKNEAWKSANTGGWNFVEGPPPTSAASCSAQPTKETPTPVVEPPQTVDTQEEPALDTTLYSVVERMNALKRTEGVEEKTLRQYLSFVALFTALTGITDVRNIRQSHASAFRADLYQLPKSWGKSPKDAQANRDQIMARAAALPPEKIGLSIGTINRHLEHLAQIVTWASDEGIYVDPKLNPTKLRRKEQVRDRYRRSAFSQDDVHRIFQHPAWSVATTNRNGTYWGPLIAAYTGARRGEIAGLMTDDIVEVDGLMCISIDNNALRRIKNLPSKRMLPIHSHLLELGLLKHVELMRRRGSPALFPEQGETASPVWGRKLGRAMRDIIDEQLGEVGSGLTFHSYRHFVQNALDRNGVDDKIVRDIIGHEGKDVHERAYRKQSTMVEMKAAIETLALVM